LNFIGPVIINKRSECGPIKFKNFTGTGASSPGKKRIKSIQHTKESEPVPVKFKNFVGPVIKEQRIKQKCGPINLKKFYRCRYR
jgi:hypothetical protein